MEIWIRRDGVEYGPCTLEQVKESVDNGGATLEDEAWMDGWDDYLTIGDIPHYSSDDDAGQLQPSWNPFNIGDIPHYSSDDDPPPKPHLMAELPRPNDEIEEIDEPKRYPVLRAIATLYQILAILTIGAGLFFIIWGFDQQDGGFIATGVMGGLIGAVTFFAAAEGILVFLDIEENTRKTEENTRKSQ
jgi:hypothetical protein